MTSKLSSGLKSVIIKRQEQTKRKLFSFPSPPSFSAEIWKLQGSRHHPQFKYWNLQASVIESRGRVCRKPLSQQSRALLKAWEPLSKGTRSNFFCPVRTVSILFTLCSSAMGRLLVAPSMMDGLSQDPNLLASPSRASRLLDLWEISFWPL